MDENRDKTLAALLVRAQEGDGKAYEEFLLEAADVLRGFLSRRLGDKESAEDILQETLLSIHRARHTYLPNRPVGPWLYAICRHRMIDGLRCKKRVSNSEVQVPQEVMDFFSHSIEENHRESERGSRVLIALEKLPENQRQVISLLKIQGLSVKEVAEKTGMSESSVKVTAFRGYEKIRKVFGVGKK